MANKHVSQFIITLIIFIFISACATNINHVDISNEKIIQQIPIENLTCQYRLVAVNDKRQNGDNAGILGQNEFSFANPEAVVSAQLIKSGMHTSDDLEGREVVVDIKHLYMSMNHSSKIPTVVYGVRIVGQDEFIIRGQAVTMIWNANEKEAYNSFGAAFQSANAQLIARLNKSCVN